jgi:hypothetical protein
MQQMTPERSGRGWGIALLVVGGWLLVRQMGWFAFQPPDLVGPAFLLLGGLGFLALFTRNRRQWWPLIPGFTLLGIGTQAAAEELLPRGIVDPLDGLIVMGAIGLGFFGVYAAQRENWWALIPGGVLSTIGLTSAVEELPLVDGEAAFFLGLAATFGLVWRLAGQSWAIWPAGALLFMGATMAAGWIGTLPWLAPLVLIGGGLWLIAGAGRRRLEG